MFESSNQEPQARFAQCRLPRLAAKKSRENRDLPNLRDRIDELSEGIQILVKDLELARFGNERCYR
jgi:hypothetical protein